MTTNPIPPDLRDELAALRARVTELEAAPTSGPARSARRNTRRRWHPGRRLATTLLLALLLLSVPVGVLAATFTDVPSTHPNYGDINAVNAAGIMAGCNPPANDKFCPDTKVERDDLAGALARAAGLNGHPPVARAKSANDANWANQAGWAEKANSAGYADKAATATTADTAKNAQKLEGLEADHLVRAAQADSAHKYPALRLRVTGEYNATNPAASTYNTLVTVYINAPRAGYVLVNGSAWFYGPASTPTGGYARLRHVSTGAASPVLATYAGVGGLADSLSPTYLFPVSEGTNAFALDVAEINSGDGATVDAANGTLTALFVPFNGLGAAP